MSSPFRKTENRGRTSVRENIMKKRISYQKSVVAVMLLMFVCPSASCGGMARVLEDSELDQICAGGLNLDFDKFLGSYSSTAETVSKGGMPDSAIGLQSPVVVENNGRSVEILEIRKPTAPTMPNRPNAPTMPHGTSTSYADPNEHRSIGMNTATTQSVLDQSVADLSGLPDGAAQAVETSWGSVQEDYLADFSKAEAAIQDVPLETTQFQMQDPVVPATAVSSDAFVPVDTGVATAANPGVSAPATATALSGVPQPAMPKTPSAPQMPNTPAMRFDVIAEKGGGDFAVAVSKGSSEALSSAPLFTASAGGQNYLNVTDTAQQNLEALVNVNAAGSVVPIQLNLTVLINSNVENLNLSNDLDLNNYATFQF